MQPHQQRVVDEKSELDERLFKLRLFFNTDIFNNLQDDEINRLKEQASIMQRYSDILSLRISAFK